MILTYQTWTIATYAQPTSPTPEQPQFRPQSKKLLDQVAEVMRYHRYSKRSEQSYVRWIIQFVLFSDKRHPSELGMADIEGFLSHLVINRNVAAAIQSQALQGEYFKASDAPYVTALFCDSSVGVGYECSRRSKIAGS